MVIPLTLPNLLPLPAAGKKVVRYELADILRKYGDDYRANHTLPLHVHKVFNAIQNCRTSALGGHIDVCSECGTMHISYNSCRDRHCPKCQGLERERWVEARKEELLPIPYFHTIFTLPHEINIWASWNEALIYNLLFRTAAATLQEFAKRDWQGELGFTAILHTWGQTLEQHIHLHCLVVGGALSLDGKTFQPCPHETWLFSVEQLSKSYREKYLDALQKAYDNGQLATPPGYDFQTLRDELGQHEWVVYAKPPFAGPATIIEYIGRYTYRIAISNNRILDIAGGKITFTYKDYRDDSKIKTMVLSADEFIRRFILHILPEHFVRIRHYGILACGHRADKLNYIRMLLNLPLVISKASESYDEFLQRLTGEDIHLCPYCGGRLQHSCDIPAIIITHPIATIPSYHDPPINKKVA